MLTSRTFGVEIECGFPGGPSAASRLFESTPGFGHWSEEYIHHDGTNTEIPSPVLSGVAGLKELRSAMKLLTDNGAYVTTADGMHVHHGAPEFVDDEALTWKLVESWVANQRVIGELVVPYRRSNYWACPITWNEQNIAHYKEMERDVYVNPWAYPRDQTPIKKKYHPKEVGMGRGALNVGALGGHGTIEIRQHEGCLDPNVAEAWIRFGQGFIETVARSDRPLTCASSVADLLTTVGMTQKSRAVALAKVANQPELAGDPNDDYYDDDYCADCDSYSCGCW